MPLRPEGIPRRLIEREGDLAATLIGAHLARNEPPPLYAILILFGALELLKQHERRHHRTVRLGLSITPVEKRRSPMDPVTIDGSKQDVLCECTPTDANGSPTTPTIEWVSSDPSVIRLEVAADTRSARGIALKDGTVDITAHTGSVAEKGTVVVTGLGTPPPPSPTVNLALKITAVDKQPV